MDSYVNKRLGDYRIVEEIGSGGMGKVYRAEHVHLKKNFAVKILPAELAADKGFVARFHDEARVMSDLRHPGIVQVLNMSCQDGVYFLAMDYVTGPEGKPLSVDDHLRGQGDTRLPENDVREWAVQIAEPLAYAHKRGVVHRDIKPANILIDAKGKVLLTDFGLAKAIGNEFIISQIHETMQRTLSNEKTHAPTDAVAPQDTLSGKKTLTGQPAAEDTLSGQPTILPNAGSDADEPRSSATSILGTYDYMAPEQRGEGGTIDHRSDIYSFGVLLYRLLTGRRPVGFAKPPSQAVPGLSEQWDTITARCLAFEKEERYQSAEELLTDLQDVAAAEREIMPPMIVVPDDYPTIQKAIDAATEGDTVKVKPGVYREALHFKNGIDFIGEGMDVVTVRCDTKKGAVLKAENCASGFIKGFTFEHTGPDDNDNQHPVVRISNSSTEVLRCRIQNGTSNGMHIVEKSKAVIRECVFQSNRWGGITVSGKGTAPTLKGNTCSKNTLHGIQFSDGAGGVAEGNTCTENKHTGIATFGIGTAPTLKANRCSKNEGFGIYFGDSAGGVAEGNTCTENESCGILASGTGTAPTLKANRCSKNEGSGIYFADSAGGVAEGNTCTENESCGIVASDTGTAPALKNNTCRKNELHGIYFDKGAGGVAESNTCTENKSSGIRVCDEGTAPTLKSNTCSKNTPHGIQFSDGAHGVAVSNTCTENESCGIAAFNGGTAPTLKINTCSKNELHGIQFSDGAHGMADSNTCTDNKSCGIAAFGIGTGPTLKNNTCSMNEELGIQFSNGAGGVAEGNTCTKNIKAGIAAFDAGTTPTLKNNMCSKSENHGIYFREGAGGVAERNTCTENESCGVVASGTGTAPTLNDNTCRKNELHGIYFDKGAGGVAESNTCTENKSCGIGASGAGTAPALKNNTCSKNELHGICFWDSAGGVAEGNKCDDNIWWAIYYHELAEPEIKANNSASGNKQGQIRGR